MQALSVTWLLTHTQTHSHRHVWLKSLLRRVQTVTLLQMRLSLSSALTDWNEAAAVRRFCSRPACMRLCVRVCSLVVFTRTSKDNIYSNYYVLELFLCWRDKERSDCLVWKATLTDFFWVFLTFFSAMFTSNSWKLSDSLTLSQMVQFSLKSVVSVRPLLPFCNLLIAKCYTMTEVETASLFIPVWWHLLLSNFRFNSTVHFDFTTKRAGPLISWSTGALLLKASSLFLSWHLFPCDLNAALGQVMWPSPVLPSAPHMLVVTVTMEQVWVCEFILLTSTEWLSLHSGNLQQ